MKTFPSRSRGFQRSQMCRVVLAAQYRACGGGGFQRYPHFDQVVDALRRDRSQANAPVGFVDYHALALQHAQGFAHRHPAHPQLRCQIVLDDAVAREDQAL